MLEQDGLRQRDDVVHEKARWTCDMAAMLTRGWWWRAAAHASW
jgi:hypothetical protein